MRCPSLSFALPALLFITSSLAIPAQSDIAGLIKSGQIDPQIFDPNYVHFDCGNSADQAPEDLLQAHDQLHAARHRGSAVARRVKGWSKRQWSEVVVPVYMHIVTTAEKAAAVPDNMYQAQLATLNQKYRATGFRFSLANVTRTVDDAWATASSFADMQKALRQGAYGALNLYFLTDIAGGVLGICSMPTNIGSSSGAVAPAVYETDGCVVSAGTMPQGPIMGYNQGLTAVHETGHWLGLFHVFEGNACDGAGDFIADTPAQSTSTSGCPKSKDSCPSLPGADAVHNFMDYSTDACYEGFTEGQIARMQELWTMYRAGH